MSDMSPRIRKSGLKFARPSSHSTGRHGPNRARKSASRIADPGYGSSPPEITLCVQTSYGEYANQMTWAVPDTGNSPLIQDVPFDPSGIQLFTPDIYNPVVATDHCSGFADPDFCRVVTHGAMSQTLTMADSTDILTQELCVAPTVDEYAQVDHYTQAKFFHGYPSPPQELSRPEMDALSLGSPHSVTLDRFPATTTDAWPQSFMVQTSDDGPSAPRPIRSATEKSAQAARITVATAARPERARARSDPLYDRGPDEDGYYHCPMTGDGACNHTPTKQKCIYAKYLDSHLKPYACTHGKDQECDSLRFSSNACLFRHEREAHGLHNHGMNPYPCLFPECDRAREDNGFPRRWNQRDHMRRVHDWIDPEELAADRVEKSADISRRRSKSTARPNYGLPMKQSSSSRARSQATTHLYGVRSNVSMVRYETAAEEQLRNVSLACYHGSAADLQLTPFKPLQYPTSNDDVLYPVELISTLY